MNRRSFFSRVSKAIAGAALVTHVCLGDLVPVLPVAEPELSIAEIDEMLQELWSTYRVGPDQFFFWSPEAMAQFVQTVKMVNGSSIVAHYPSAVLGIDSAESSDIIAPRRGGNPE